VTSQSAKNRPNPVTLAAATIFFRRKQRNWKKTKQQQEKTLLSGSMILKTASCQNLFSCPTISSRRMCNQESAR
jgi:hypothetical protein